MKWEDMVKGLGNNGVVIVEGECGEGGATNVEGGGGKRVPNHGGQKVVKEKLQTWDLSSNNM